MELDRKRTFLVIAAVVVTFIVLRAYLYVSPNTDFNVGAYNIHHLFSGLVLVTLGGLPLAMFHGQSRFLDGAALVFGVGLSMALDEWVYLIATDGSNTSYLLPVSFWGGVVAVGLACAYAFALALMARRHRKDDARA